MPLYDPVYGYPQQQFVQMPVAPMPQVQTPQNVQQTSQPPYVKIVTVSGEAGAKALKLAPGSTLLAADEEQSVIWFVKANEVGPNSVTPIPFDPAIFSGGSSSKSPDLSAIETRIASIEERMNRYESNDGTDKQRSNTGNSGNRH